MAQRIEKGTMTGVKQSEENIKLVIVFICLESYA